MWIIELECTEIDGGTELREEPPGSGNWVEVERPDRYRWQRVDRIDLPVPRGRVRLTHHKNLMAGAGLAIEYGRSCDGQPGLGWRGTYAEPDRLVQPPTPQAHVFKTDMTVTWRQQEIISRGRLICAPDDTAAVQVHIRNRADGSLLQQFAQDHTQYDIAAAVAARVNGYPYRELVSIGISPAVQGLVGLRTYYWLSGLEQAPLSGETVTVGPAGAPLQARVIVSPRETRWDWGDGGAYGRQVTSRRGLAYPEAELPDGQPAPQAISYIYERDSRTALNGAFRVQTSVDWAGRWSLLEEQQPLGGYAEVILSFADNLPIFSAPTVTVEHERSLLVRQARALLVAPEQP
jgi:hypothetical protein